MQTNHNINSEVFSCVSFINGEVIFFVKLRLYASVSIFRDENDLCNVFASNYSQYGNHVSNCLNE